MGSHGFASAFTVGRPTRHVRKPRLVYGSDPASVAIRVDPWRPFATSDTASAALDDRCMFGWLSPPFTRGSLACEYERLFRRAAGVRTACRDLSPRHGVAASEISVSDVNQTV